VSLPRPVLSRRIIRHLPKVAITDTWQVILALTMIGIGLATVAAVFLPGQTGGVISRSLSNIVLRMFWALSFLVGGVSQLLGVTRSYRALERFGMMLCLLGCVAYGLTLLGSFIANLGMPSLFLSGTFLTIALGYFVKILVSNTAASQDRELV
jgi:hypothetical protein